MQQLIINITNESKGRSLINFLKQLDFVKIEKVSKEKQLLEFESEINESISDLKEEKVIEMKNYKKNPNLKIYLNLTPDKFESVLTNVFLNKIEYECIH